MSLEQAIQNLADAINNLASKSTSTEATGAKEPRAGKSKSAAPVAEPSLAQTQVVASPTPVQTLEAPLPAPTEEVDPFGAEADAVQTPITYEDMVAALKALSGTPGKGRDAVMAVLTKFGAKSVPELGSKPDISFADVVAAAKAA